MVGILSDSYDRSTDKVIEWLEYYGVNWTRINGADLIECGVEGKISLDLDRMQVGVIEDLFSCSVIWFRRFFPHTTYAQFNSDSLKMYSEEELNVLHEYIFRRFENPIIGHFSDSTNKLFALQQAKEIGLKIPRTLVTNSRETLLKFQMESDEGIIIKPISEGLNYESIDGRDFTTYTTEIGRTDINSLEEFFFPLLVQAKVPKLFELRVFYFLEECYSMAIFSQSHEETLIDYRLYPEDRPNRFVPYNLPTTIVSKLALLMKELRLNTGSIDLIVTDSYEFVFLEVNPNGQFGMVSYPCNYYLETLIAKTLASYE